MKRILYLTFYFRPDLCAGSFRNSPLVNELARQTQDKEIEIDVLTTSPNRYSTFREEYEETETVDNVTIQRIWVPSHESGIKDQIFSFKTYYFEVLKRTKNRKYDLVFASSSRFFTSYLGYRIAKKNSIPLYVDVRDLFSETLESISNSWFIEKFVVPVVKNREKKIYHYASHINLISEGFKEGFPHGSNTSLSFYTHGVDPIFKQAQTKTDNPETGYLKNIVYAGNIGDGQGLHKIIPEAAKQLDGYYKFTLVGDGGARKKLEEHLREKDVKNVELLEPVNRDEVVGKYKNADILFIHLNDLQVFKKVLPSKIFELAVIEKPILAGVRGYARDFLKENVEGVFLFDPGDIKGLIQQVQEIEKYQEEQKEIDNSEFVKKYSRKEVNRKMVHSILRFL